MKFENIGKFLEYKTACPFCKSGLETKIKSLYINGPQEGISNPIIQNNEIRFTQASSYKIPGMIDAGSHYAFNVTLFKNNGKIKYNVIKSIQHQGVVRADQFIQSFNNSKLFIGKFCMNAKCSYRYSFCSTPLYFDMYIPQPRLREPETLSESFEIGKYDCVNSYVKNRMMIYDKNRDDEARGVPTEFMNLENIEMVKNLEHRIKTLLVFS